MSLDYSTLDILRQNHPAWRLLRADHAPLMVSFLYRAYVEPNVRVLPQADLVEALEDELFALRERLGEEAFPKPALQYLNDWAAPDKGWLRRFYETGSDEPRFDLMPATEKAIAWLRTLTDRPFVGTESRLLTMFELLRQMRTGSEPDPEARVADLRRRRAELDSEIARVLGGDVQLLDDTALKDRFQQFTNLARELLSDFREVEHNFRALDRRVRERVALWEGGKGALLEEILGDRDAISESDQGKSFRAFWDLLMSTNRQVELTDLLDHVLELAPVAALRPDQRLRRVHYDWLEAGDHTQRTVAQLSQQLRRFLDDKAWVENRRIMEILHGIETKALALRETPPAGDVMFIDSVATELALLMERPLYNPAVREVLGDVALEAGDDDLDASALYSAIVIDKAELARHVRLSLQQRPQVTLAELCQTRPLQHGLAELVAYLQLAAETLPSRVDEDVVEEIVWTHGLPDGAQYTKRARLPRVVYVRQQ